MNILNFNLADAAAGLIGTAIFAACFGLLFSLIRFLVFTYFERND